MSGAAIWAFHSNMSEKWERSTNLYFWIQHTLEHLYHKEAIQIEERERKIRRNRLLGFRLRVDSREVSGGDVCIWSCGGGIFENLFIQQKRYVCIWCCDVRECPWNYCGSIKKMFAVKVGRMETFGQCREKESFKEKDKLSFFLNRKKWQRNQILITR